METLAVDALRQSRFTRGIPRSQRSRLAGIAHIRAAEPGTVLLREGDPTAELGVVLEGRVALRVHVPGRGPVTILTVEGGDIFGWSAVVPPYRSTSTAVAVERTEVIVFEAEALRQLLLEDEDVAAAVYPRILRSVARRLEATRTQLLDLFAPSGEMAW